MTDPCLLWPLQDKQHRPWASWTDDFPTFLAKFFQEFVKLRCSHLTSIDYIDIIRISKPQDHILPLLHLSSSSNQKD